MSDYHSRLLPSFSSGHSNAESYNYNNSAEFTLGTYNDNVLPPSNCFDGMSSLGFGDRPGVPSYDVVDAEMPSCQVPFNDTELSIRYPPAFTDYDVVTGDSTPNFVLGNPSFQQETPTNSNVFPASEGPSDLRFGDNLSWSSQSCFAPQYSLIAYDTIQNTICEPQMQRMNRTQNLVGPVQSNMNTLSMHADLTNLSTSQSLYLLH